MRLACHTQQEIADAIGYAQRTVADFLRASGFSGNAQEHVSAKSVDSGEDALPALLRGRCGFRRRRPRTSERPRADIDMRGMKAGDAAANQQREQEPRNSEERRTASEDHHRGEDQARRGTPPLGEFTKELRQKSRMRSPACSRPVP